MVKYHLADQSFATKAAVLAHASAILNRGEIGAALDPTEQAFIEALLAVRRDKLAAIGSRKIVSIIRDRQPGPIRRTRCFWVVLDDGSRVDLSVYKAVGAL